MNTFLTLFFYLPRHCRRAFLELDATCITRVNADLNKLIRGASRSSWMSDTFHVSQVQIVEKQGFSLAKAGRIRRASVMQ